MRCPPSGMQWRCDNFFPGPSEMRISCELPGKQTSRRGLAPSCEDPAGRVVCPLGSLVGLVPSSPFASPLLRCITLKMDSQIPLMAKVAFLTPEDGQGADQGTRVKDERQAGRSSFPACLSCCWTSPARD